MKFIGGSAVRKLLGTSRKERSLYSPVKLAGRIKIPVLMVHGTEDRTVAIDHGRKMNRALKRQKLKNYKYVELEDGDHHLSLQKNRIRLFEEMEDFLATYLD
jgi:dipeptidyl aminopeptidase/acylaminoacyl peptidase